MRTTVGRDWQARIMGDGTDGDAGNNTFAPADWIALTADGTSPDAGDTTLTGEITSGTLARAEGVYAHTNGQASYTVSKTFTSDQVVTLRKGGMFNDPTAGTMAFEELLSSEAALEISDQILITHTVTL